MRKYSRLFIAFLLCFYGFISDVKAEDPLTWQDCVKEAAKNHPDLISAEENIKESEASKNIAASALFPQIDSSADFSTAKKAGSDTNTYTHSYGATGTQLLFYGAKTINDVRASAENIKAAQYNYK